MKINIEGWKFGALYENEFEKLQGWNFMNGSRLEIDDDRGGERSGVMIGSQGFDIGGIGGLHGYDLWFFFLRRSE